MRTMTRIATALALTAASLASTGLLAAEARYNQIALRAEVNQEVAREIEGLIREKLLVSSAPAKAPVADLADAEVDF